MLPPFLVAPVQKQHTSTRGLRHSGDLVRAMRQCHGLILYSAISLSFENLHSGNATVLFARSGDVLKSDASAEARGQRLWTHHQKDFRHSTVHPFRDFEHKRVHLDDSRCFLPVLR